MRLLAALFVCGLFAASAPAKDIDVGGGDKFPKEVNVGDVIKFDRPSVGGRLSTIVTANGKPVEGKLVQEKKDGKTLIGGGKMTFEVKADKAGALEIEINVKVAGAKDKDTTNKYTITVK